MWTWRCLTHEENVTSDDTDHVIESGLERVPQRRPQSGDEVPVKTHVQEAQSFISGGTAEKIGKGEIVLIRKTKHRNTREDDEDVLGEDFPHENRGEDNVKDFQAFLRLVFVSVQGFKESRHGQIDGPDHLGWVH
jgi:hypothetical protein